MSLLDDDKDLFKNTSIENTGFPNIDDIRIYDKKYNTIDFCDYCDYAKFYHWENELYFYGIRTNLYFPTYYREQKRKPVSISSIIATISKNKNYWVGKIYLCFQNKGVGNEELFIYSEQERVVNRNSIVRENIMEFKIQNEPRKRWIYKGFLGFELQKYAIYGRTIKEVQTQIYRTLKLIKKDICYVNFLWDLNNPDWKMIENCKKVFNSYTLPIISSPEELYKTYNEYKNI